jgi:hypothetical protein
VVAGDHQLELRLELEEVLPHETGRDQIAARRRFDLCLGPTPALLQPLRKPPKSW